MSEAYRSNHYVPQWYQRRFIPRDQRQRELYLLDLKPESFVDGTGMRRTRRDLRRTGTRKCFAVEDLYTTRFGAEESRALERVFFGEVDRRGQRAVDHFAGFDHTSADARALQDLMLYMSTQKLRTPKGLDWLMAQAGVRDRQAVLSALTRLRTLYGAIWAECVWQIADAADSPTKFIVSDHPVTVYNRALGPSSLHWCQGSNDPDIRLQGTHTLFPLSGDRLLILTNRLWACSPRRSPVVARPNPDLFRGAMFNFLEIQTCRRLSEQEVREINFVIKARAYRYVAAAREEWLYPERHVAGPWRSLGRGHLFMPNPRSLSPGAEITLGYDDGSMEMMDTFGREPGQPGFGREAQSAREMEAHRAWSEEFDRLFDTEARGGSWEDKQFDRARAHAA